MKRPRFKPCKSRANRRGSLSLSRSSRRPSSSLRTTRQRTKFSARWWMMANLSKMEQVMCEFQRVKVEKLTSWATMTTSNDLLWRCLTCKLLNLARAKTSTNMAGERKTGNDADLLAGSDWCFLRRNAGFNAHSNGVYCDTIQWINNSNRKI